MQCIESIAWLMSPRAPSFVSCSRNIISPNMFLHFAWYKLGEVDIDFLHDQFLYFHYLQVYIISIFGVARVEFSLAGMYYKLYTQNFVSF